MEDSNQRLRVARLFFDINKTISRNFRRCFEDTRLTMPQHMVVTTLFKSGEMKLTDLSREINLSNSTISGIIDRLEKQQLVSRRRSEEDRRVIYVRVTPEFEEAHKEFQSKAVKTFEEILGEGTTGELEKIIEGLETLKKIIT